jgi:hypothetical protein
LLGASDPEDFFHEILLIRNIIKDENSFFNTPHFFESYRDKPLEGFEEKRDTLNE